jgi:hypothetical protein
VHRRGIEAVALEEDVDHERLEAGRHPARAPDVLDLTIGRPLLQKERDLISP